MELEPKMKWNTGIQKMFYLSVQHKNSKRRTGVLCSWCRRTQNNNLMSSTSFPPETRLLLNQCRFSDNPRQGHAVPGGEWLSVMFAHYGVTKLGVNRWGMSGRLMSLNTPYADNKLRLMLFLQLWACRWSDCLEVLMRNRIWTHMWVRQTCVTRIDVYGFVCLFVSTSGFISPVCLSVWQLEDMYSFFLILNPGCLDYERETNPFWFTS